MCKKIPEETQMVAAADLIAALAHRGQKDHSGLDYISHPRTVAGYVNTPVEKVVALLHDTLEDTELTAEDLLPVFGQEIVDTLRILTHDPTEPYMDYVRRISENELATAVKKADLRHNMQLSRLKTVTQADLDRIEKYKKAYALLETAWPGRES